MLTSNHNWPHLNFYRATLQKISLHQIKNKYDLTKLTNMLSWFVWLIAHLSSDKYAALNVMHIVSIDDSVTIDTRFDVLEKIIKEIADYAEPNSRYELSYFLFNLIAESQIILLFNQLIDKHTTRSILPAVVLANTLFTNNNDSIHSELIDKCKNILMLISNNYIEGRFFQSIMNALMTIANVKDVTITKKINLIYLVLNSDKAQLKQLIEQFAYSLITPSVLKKQNDLHIKIKNALTTLPTRFEKLIAPYLTMTSAISKDKALKLKRQWQSELASYFKHEYFAKEMSYWMLIQGLCKLKQTDLFEPEQSIYDCVMNTLIKIFELTEAQKQQYDTNLACYSNQGIILTYFGKLKSLPDSVNLPLIRLYKKMIQKILSPHSHEFYEERYNLKLPHLAKLFSKNPLLLVAWRRGYKTNFKNFIDQHTVKLQCFVFDANQFILEKIFLHKHINFKVNELAAYIKATLDHERLAIKNQLANILEVAKSNNFASTEYHRIAFMYSLIGLLENLNLEKNQQLTLLKTAHEHLSSLTSKDEFLHDLHDVINQLKPKKNSLQKINYANWQLIDTDDYWYLFTCGNLPGSCQRIDGEPELNKALLAYVIDGKIRLLAIVDENGKMIARAIIRLLYDTKKNKPVLLLESAYFEGIASKFVDTLESFAKTRAQALNVALVVSSRYRRRHNKLSYPNDIISLGSAAPSEYVDSLFTQCPKGIYRVKNTLEIHAPQPRLIRVSSCHTSWFNASEKKKSDTIAAQDDSKLLRLK